jgi:hypothetical protein
LNHLVFAVRRAIAVEPAPVVGSSLASEIAASGLLH